LAFVRLPDVGFVGVCEGLAGHWHLLGALCGVHALLFEGVLEVCWSN
jgi:hypothetical protein